MTELLFSVITPTYQRWPLLQQAIGSALGQTCGDLEILVVDDGSTDGTRERVGSLSDRVRLLTCERLGPAGARNVALREARGELVAFLDSDDLWLSDHLAGARDVFQSRPEVDFTFADARFVSARRTRESYLQGKPIEAVPYESFGGWRVFQRSIYPELVMEPCVATSSVVVRRSALERVGGFDEQWTPFGEDNDLWLRIAAGARAAGKWAVSVERRKLGGNLVVEEEEELRLSQQIQVLEVHRRGPGREHRRAIRRRLGTLLFLRGKARLRARRPAGLLDLTRALALAARSS